MPLVVLARVRVVNDELPPTVQIAGRATVVPFVSVSVYPSSITEVLPRSSFDHSSVVIRKRIVVGEGFRYELPEEHAERIESRRTGDRLILGVRPENIRIAGPDDARTIPAVVDVVEPIGSDNYVYLRVGKVECTVRVPADVRPTEGEDVEISFDDSSIHLFDSETEENLLLPADRAAASPSAPTG